ncbi:hypothetical protein [Acrocarpospora sp. B8E8]|uniref:hypothetical protein n=1 Tax=Acrocarpospora sp. B8E8 TaxID=3153572 RepID=UPI00325C44C9
MSAYLIGAGVAGYMAVGYWLYVPRAVRLKTDLLIAEWREDAHMRAMEYDSTRLRHQLFRSVRNERDREFHRRYQADTAAHVEAIRSEPVPVDRLRRQAARGWWHYSLTWPLNLTILLLIKLWDAAKALSAVVSDHAASRSVKPEPAPVVSVADRLAEIDRQVVRIEKELRDEFGIRFDEEADA